MALKTIDARSRHRDPRRPVLDESAATADRPETGRGEARDEPRRGLSHRLFASMVPIFRWWPPIP